VFRTKPAQCLKTPVEDVDEPRLTVSGAARRLGIAPATLRTWDRRYGIGPTGHARGRHRRYSADDMARLELMQRALIQGAAPADLWFKIITNVVAALLLVWLGLSLRRSA